jgi:hypothetical protein
MNNLLEALQWNRSQDGGRTLVMWAAKATLEGLENRG